MNRTTRRLAAAALTLACGIGTAAAQDHPLLSAYAGSVIDSRAVEEFGPYKLIKGRDAKGEFIGEALEGRLTRLVYRNPADRSTLEIFDNYRRSLSRAGMGTIWSCALDECGPAYARSAWGRFNGLFAATGGDPRYLAGRIASGKGTAYVAVLVAKSRTQVDVLEVAAMQEGLVSVDAAALGAGLDRDGRVSVYGIFFDTDKSAIKPESKPALDEIATLLEARPDLALYVVGHTDMTGALAHNRTLSEARAQAVVDALVDGYGIAAARLEGHGVGPLAPAGSNASETERAKNRRVELVARM
jgi:OOP family OmpA-OmpF porin